MILKYACGNLVSVHVIYFDHTESERIFPAVSLLTAEQETRNPHIKITILFHILFLCLQNSDPLTEDRKLYFMLALDKIRE
jgi:hypothetical protein